MDHVRSTDGTEIAIERAGTGDPILFLHGTGARRQGLRGVAAALDGEFQSVLVGTDSKSSIRESGVVAHEAIPESRLVELDGHGHGATATAPDLVAAEVESFLAE